MKYQVILSNAGGGKHKYFFFFRSAFKYALKNLNEWSYVDIDIDNIIQIRLRAPKEHNWTLGLFFHGKMGTKLYGLEGDGYQKFLNY